ncbi:MAG TPA: hypothetical protein VD864_16980, partial [Nocardioides sp.]|nr:hypothetical protein [Nocardioides sp.]
TRVPIAVPGRQISEAMFKLFSSVPNVPDYDPEVAEQQTFAEAVVHAPDEVPPDPNELRARAHADDGIVWVSAAETGTGVIGVQLDPDEAERFGLAVLAAVAYVRASQPQAIL